MKKISLALLLLATTSFAAVAEEAKPSSPMSKYSLDDEIGQTSNRSFFLTKDGDKWSWSNRADIDRDGVDVIAVDFQTRTIRLITKTSPNEAATKAQQLGLGGNRLGVDKDYKPGRDEDGRWNCVYSTMPKSMDNGNRQAFGYNICASSFLKEVPKKGDPGAGNLWRSRKFVVIDKDKLFAAIESSGLAAELDSLELAAYRNAFERAKTSVALQTFAMGYQKLGFDPDGLIPKAELLAKEREAVEDKAADAKAAAKQADARRLAEERADAERRRAEQVAAERLVLDKWRRSIAVETETSCGPVLELKGKELVKVYFQVAGMPVNEHWLKRAELSPAGQPCSKFATVVNYQKGDRVCSTTTGTTRRIVAQSMGNPIYSEPENISIRMVASIEDQTPDKVKVSISGITTDNIESGKRDNTGDRISWADGTSRQVGQTLWDSRANWKKCN